MIYAWQQEREGRQARDAAYAERVERVFEESGGTYGADRVAGQLRKDGFSASFKKVKRIMNEHGLFSVHLRYQRILTDSRGARDEDCPNLLRDKPEIRPLRVLSSDITYIPTQEGFAYTCTIRDLRSGVVLAEKTASRMKKELVHPIGRFRTREEAAQGVFTFINGFYNTTRIQKNLPGICTCGPKQYFLWMGYAI